MRVSTRTHRLAFTRIHAHTHTPLLRTAWLQPARRNPTLHAVVGMASASAAWEAPPDAPVWEQEDYVGDDDASDAPPDPNVDPDAASTEFLDVLIGLYLESKVSARHVCTLFWWAKKAGAKGQLLGEYALRPDQTGSGNWQRHVEL
eukprot:6737900-Alexandrium_andersonii.AAC.1